MSRPKHHAGLASGAAKFLVAFAAALVPPEPMTVDQWAAEHRVVSAESGSPYPGLWDNDRAPYGIEIQECLSFSHPCHSVALKKSHQIAGTEFGLNLIGYAVDREPSPIIVVLPTLDEAKKYVKVKLQPTIDDTPALRHKVMERKSRDESGSTTSYKKFRGGYIQVTGANTSRGLQMISGRVMIADELSEWPDDVDDRGDPLALAEKRLTAWDLRDPKRYYLSTPGLKGSCRISAKYDASDQRRYYVPCPHCGHFQVLAWERMRWRSETWPYGAYFVCAAHGCTIEHAHKQAMVAAGCWVKTYPDEGREPGDVIAPADLDAYRARSSKGRQPGFAIWQAYSGFTFWDKIVQEWKDAKDDPFLVKVFTQQVLGEDYEEKGDAPDYQALMLRRENYRPRQVPPGALVLTGMVDVQVNRLEYAVYGWGPGMSGWLVDRGIVEGDPSQPDVWRKLAPVVEREYQDAHGVLWPVELYGVDAGFLSNMVYLFCRGRERVFALDGQPGHQRPMMGTPRPVEINYQGKKIRNGVMLWPTGTWPVKSWVYGALRKTIDGPDSDGNWPLGAIHFNDLCDEDFFKQITAEHLAAVEERGRIIRRWEKKKNQANEQLDLIVGCRALASYLGLDRLTPDEWLQLARERGHVEDVQPDLAAQWSPMPQPAAPATTTPSPAPAAVSDDDWFGDRQEGFWG